MQAARLLLATTAYQLRDDPKRSLPQLLHLLLTADFSTLAETLKGTAAASLVSEDVAKMAISIRAILATSLNSLLILKGQGQPFSIRQWVHDCQDKRWLFVTSSSDRHHTFT